MSQTKAQLIDPVDGTIVNADINASAAILGTKISPDFGSQNIVTTGAFNSASVTISGGTPAITFTDTNNDPDYYIQNNNGGLRIYDVTNSADRLTVHSDGHVDIHGNLDALAGLDVTGGDVTVTGVAGSTSTASEMARIDLKASHFSSAGGECKIKVYSSGAEQMGFGISTDQLNYITSDNAYDHVFYGGAAGASELLRIRGSQDYIDVFSDSVLTFNSQAGQIDYDSSSNFRFKKVSGTGYIHISNNNGDIYLDASANGDIYLRAGDGSSGIQNSIVVNSSGAVNLYHAGLGPKVQTISQGLNINHGDGGAGAASNLPRIEMGSGHHNSVGNECKIQVWDGGSGPQMGFGISANQLDYITRSDGSSRYDHVFYGGQYGTIELLRIPGAADGIDVSAQNIKFDNGYGIDFSVASSTGGTSTSGVLDDYEEGTWIPIFQGSTGHPTQSYVTQLGTYVKIGQFVHCEFDCQLASSGISAGSGFLQIANIPYAKNSTVQTYGVAASFGYTVNLGSSHPTDAYMASTNTYIYLMNRSASSGNSYSQASAVTNSTRVLGGFTFRTN